MIEPSADVLFPNRCTYGVPLEDAMAAVDAAYRRGVEDAAPIIRGLLPYADGHELQPPHNARLSALKKRAHDFLRAIASPQEVRTTA